MLVAVLVAAGLAGSEDPASISIVQESLARAQELYATAAYEDALTILDRLHTTPRKPAEARDVAVYRVFCLLALDRDAEATSAIQAIVRSDPVYRPPETQASPRIRARFNDVRTPLLPLIARETLATARVSLDRRDFAAAIAGFDIVIALSKEIGAQQPDLLSMATGLREVARTAAASQPAPPLPVAGRVYAPGTPGITPPEIMSQALPPLPAGATELPESEAVVEVVVDPSGGVQSARLVKSLLPDYDELLVEAARKWRFRPALMGAVPVFYRQTVVVALRH
jgi:TonB family protein